MNFSRAYHYFNLICDKIYDAVLFKEKKEYFDETKNSNAENSKRFPKIKQKTSYD